MLSVVLEALPLPSDLKSLSIEGVPLPVGASVACSMASTVAMAESVREPPPSCNTVSMIFFRLDSCLLKCCKKRDLVNDRVAEKK